METTIGSSQLEEMEEIQTSLSNYKSPNSIHKTAINPISSQLPLPYSNNLTPIPKINSKSPRTRILYNSAETVSHISVSSPPIAKDQKHSPKKKR